MSEAAVVPGDASRRGGRMAAGLTILAAVAAMHYARDLRQRRAAEEFGRAAGLERADLEIIGALRGEPAGDLALDTAVDAARDEDEDGRLTGNLGRKAQDLLLEAIAFRPGWPEHRYLVAVASGSGSKARARRTLQLAADGAPGVDAIWSALASAELEAWSGLSAEERVAADDAFRHALRSTRFVARHFLEIASVASVSLATGLLPDQASPLEAAAASLCPLGETAAVSRLLARAERAERRERGEELGALERRRPLGDREALQRGCATWFSRHPFGQFDDARARKELARLLDLWPDDRGSASTRNAKLRLVEFFLEEGRPEASPELLERTVASLPSPPTSLRARVALRGGKFDDAVELASASTTGDPEWTPYFLDLARYEVGRGRFEEANLALARLPETQSGRCDAALLSRQIARGRRDESGLADAGRRLAPLLEIPRGDWSASGSVLICLDPERSGRRLGIGVGKGSPTILAYGWGASRAATIALSGDATVLAISTAGRAGENALWASFLAGGSGRSLEVSLQETP